jgi:hypothetical protein
MKLEHISPTESGAWFKNGRFVRMLGIGRYEDTLDDGNFS